MSKDVVLDREKLKQIVQRAGNKTDINSLGIKISEFIVELLVEKSEQYGFAYFELRTQFKQYISMRLFDKVFRLKNQIEKEKDYVDTLVDIVGYCLLELISIAREESK